MCRVCLRIIHRVEFVYSLLTNYTSCRVCVEFVSVGFVNKPHIVSRSGDEPQPHPFSRVLEGEEDCH